MMVMEYPHSIIWLYFKPIPAAAIYKNKPISKPLIK